ncbi:hypothetical protein [Nodularia sphaerocarpa]|uniref:hypothetical protein n=1 Tax=Nodularia sphaerocarpa TaxID=137816 RepID=UPI001EFB4524|nr:hypothetical protein [Nodularia sphaerocarpa]MDB9373345.1 hypothetical protein [Nodularia sphaerocarpa CS-585]MDB9379356.1 hypothetical protein [Nodularia sphaerocarpa CS-585A2]ULP71935.1 hypothetical protein BDGGKGIB_01572 [Nodularia sphaerocarpa UHCC 0038]
MKDKHKNLKDIDLFTKLTLSQQEQINGAIGQFTLPQLPPLPNGSSTPLSPLPPLPPPEPEDDWYIIFLGRYLNFVAR